MPQRIALQPSAHPTDQYYRPDTAPPSYNSELYGLASSLRSVAPGLQRILDRHDEAFVQSSLTNGRAWAAQNAISNQEQFKGAVKAGRINETDNPWFILGVKQSYTRLEAEVMQRQVADAYLQSDLPNREASIDEVQKFVSDFYHKKFEGRDADELSILGPAEEQATSTILSTHIGMRQQKRLEEAEASTEEELKLAVEDFPKERLSDPSQVQAFNAKIDDLIKTRSAFMVPARLNAVIKQAAEKSALDQKDPSIYQRVVSRLVKSDGTSAVSPTETSRVMDGIHDHLIRQQVEDLNIEDEVRRKQEAPTIAALLVSDQPLTIDGIKNMDGLSDEGKLLLMNRLMGVVQAQAYFEAKQKNQSEEDASKYASSKLEKFFASGEPVPDELKKELFASYSQFGAEKLHNFSGIVNSIQRKDDPEWQRTLTTKYINGELTHEDLASASDHLSTQSNLEWANVLKSYDSKADSDVRSVAEDEAKNLHLRILEGLRPEGTYDINGNDIWRARDPKSYEAAQQTAFAAVAQFQDEAVNLLRNTKGDYTERTAQMRERSLSIGQAAGAIPPAQWPPKEQPKGDPLDSPAVQYYKRASAQVEADPKDIVSGSVAHDPILTAVNDDVRKSVGVALKQTPPQVEPSINAPYLDQLSIHPEVVDPRADLTGSDVEAVAGTPAPSKTAMSNYLQNRWKAQQHAKVERDTLAGSLETRQKRVQQIFTRLSTEPYPPSTEESQFLQQYVSDADLYKRYISTVGYDPEVAVEKFGPDAWQKVPLFSDTNDLRVNLKPVLTKLKVDPKLYDSFLRVQTQLITTNQKP